MANLTGNEVLHVTGVAANGQLSGQQFQTTTQQIANLGGAGNSGFATTTTNYVSSTALTVPAGLTVPNLQPGTYHVEGQIQGTAPATCGIQVELTGTAGLTTGFCNITGWNYNGTTINGVNNSTALATDLANSANAYTNISFDGTLQVLVAGTLQVQTAQHTSSTATTSVVTGSYLNLTLL